MAERDETREDAPRRDPPSISNGPNARPRNETIAQTGGGLPNDSGQPIEIDPEEERRIEEKIRAM